MRAASCCKPHHCPTTASGGHSVSGDRRQPLSPHVLQSAQGSFPGFCPPGSQPLAVSRLVSESEQCLRHAGRQDVSLRSARRTPTALCGARGALKTLASQLSTWATATNGLRSHQHQHYKYQDDHHSMVDFGPRAPTEEQASAKTCAHAEGNEKSSLRRTASVCRGGACNDGSISKEARSASSDVPATVGAGTGSSSRVDPQGPFCKGLAVAWGEEQSD